MEYFDDVTTCPECGNDKPAGVPLCHHCTGAIAQEPCTYRCNRCGNDVIEFDFPYCPHCKSRGDWDCYK